MKGSDCYPGLRVTLGYQHGTVDWVAHADSRHARAYVRWDNLTYRSVRAEWLSVEG